MKSRISIFAVVLSLFAFFPQVSLASTNVSGTISFNDVWTKANSPYIIGVNFLIPSGVTLTLEPGVVVKFNTGTTTPTVQGTIIAQGTPTDKIVFTSIKDDTVGGDTNGDGLASVPTSADWNMDFLGTGTTTPSAIFEHTTFTYMGDLYFDTISATFSHSEIAHTYDGFHIDQGSTVTLLDISFHDIFNAAIKMYHRSTLTASSLNIDMQGMRGNALYMDSSSADVQDSVFENGADSFVIDLNNRGTPASLVLKNSTIRNVLNDAIGVFDSGILLDQVTIENPVDYGVLLYKSTATLNNVSITNPGLSALTVWGSTAVVTNSNFKDGAYDGIEIDTSGGVASTLTLKNSTVENFLGPGIYIADSAMSLDRVTIRGNATGVEAYIADHPEWITLANSSIADNVDGIVNYGSTLPGGSFGFTTLDFANTWWGDSTGPLHTTNPGGFGNSVSDHILFTPWLTSAPAVGTSTPPIATSTTPTLSFATSTPDGLFEGDGTQDHKGYDTTDFTFSVIYTSAANQAPDSVVVNIGLLTLPFAQATTSVDMANASSTLHDGNYRNGEAYTFTRTFSPGTYQYLFTATTGTSTISLPTSFYGTQQLSFTVEPSYSNVLFFPGVMGSRLYEKFDQSVGCDLVDREQERWVSAVVCDQDRLALSEIGKSMNPLYTKEGAPGVVNGAYGSNIYQSFIDNLNTWKNTDHIINDYALVPYDWRLSLEDIITNGATSTPGTLSYTTSQSFSESYILKELERLQKTSRTEKVTIVAHSYGGLVTKALIQKLKDTNNPLYNKIDKIIFVSVPQIGTPEAIMGILHGAPIGGGFVMHSATSRALAKNMPMMYNLLPSTEYFNVVDPGYAVDKVASFENIPFYSAQTSLYGVYVSNENELKRYILNDDNRPVPDYYATHSPAVGNPLLYNDATTTHAVLDKWQPASTTKLILVGGWGEETMAGLDYTYSALTGEQSFTPRMVVDGDGTVVEPSALWMATSTPGVERWWVNLDEYNRNNIPDRVHKSVLEVGNLRSLIKSKIVNSTFSDPQNIVVNATSTLVSTGERLHFILHSPLTLGITDSLGRYTGLDPVTGEVKEEIPNTTYKQYGEVQFLSVPTGLQYTLKLKGYATGSFTLDVEKQLGNTVTETTSFQSIPSATTTAATMDVPSVFAVASSTLTIDQNGDGTTDALLKANPSGVTMYDLTAPTTTVTPAGTIGLNSYYTSAVTVTLSADDATPLGEVSSGVAMTKYLLDHGTTWNTYSTTTPLIISTEGTTTLQYYSTDNNGNSETPKTLTLKIDTVAPTIFASDTSAEQLSASGTPLVVVATAEDNIDSNPTLVSSVPLSQTFAPGITSITLTTTDTAGNTATKTITVTVYSSPTADPDGDGVPNQDDVKPFDPTVFANLTIPSEYALWEKESFDFPFSVAGKGSVTLSLSNTYYSVGTSPIKDSTGTTVPTTVTTTDGVIMVSFAQEIKDLKTYTLTLTTKKGNTKERDSIKKKRDTETNEDKKHELEQELKFASAPIVLGITNTIANKTASQTATVNIYDKQQTAQIQYKYKDTDHTTTLLLKSDDVLKLKMGQPLVLTVKVSGIKKDVLFTSNITGNFTMLSVVQEEEHSTDTDRKQTKFSLFYPLSTPTTQETINITTSVNGVTQTDVVNVVFVE